MPDNYPTYYADKLWNLLPAVYRTQDSDTFGVNGPLREIVNRIGAQAAILRRSIDRLWENQSPETCDDWVIPYIGDLLATNLVSSLDARGQRLLVAKTIYYRRRKGTVAILEELAADVTGWDARVVEFFRRLSRTRHSLDPAIGLPSSTDDPLGGLMLQLAEGLLGKFTHSQIGGWADLRNSYGATKTQTAFDEYFHTADLRRGKGQVGWQNIPHLGIFLWRLYSLGLSPTTPVQYQGCPGHFTFDPTGREMPLFAASIRGPGSTYWANWTSPEEWQLPGPISTQLLQAELPNLYTNSLSVLFRDAAGNYLTIDPVQLILYPELGRFSVKSPPAGDVFTTYHFGFSSEIGAGPYDRAAGGPVPPQPLPAFQVRDGNPVNVSGGTGTTTIGDSLTYASAADVVAIADLNIRAADLQRPVLRLTADWVFTGAPDAVLALDGLFVSGADIVLLGDFSTVTIACCTLDPGTQASGAFALAADARPLRPTHLWIEGNVATLNISRSILGSVRTRAGGAVETLNATDSIFQSIPEIFSPTLTDADIKDSTLLLSELQNQRDAVSKFLATEFNATNLSSLVAGLNGVIAGPSLYDASRFANVRLSPETKALLATGPTGPDLERLNRLLLGDAYPEALADAVFAFIDGVVNLSRCTILGRSYVHRFDASECILDDITLVDDTQHGCIRFTAWSTGSVIPRQYESVQVAPRSAIIHSRDFGRPDYAALHPSVSTAILEGAADGSEMGVFAREKVPIKQRSLQIKMQEFMPLGLVPVVVEVTP